MILAITQADEDTAFARLDDYETDPLIFLLKDLSLLPPPPSLFNMKWDNAFHFVSLLEFDDGKMPSTTCKIYVLFANSYLEYSNCSKI